MHDIYRFMKMGGKMKISPTYLFPVLDEKTKETRFDAHYFYHPIWAFNRILTNKPKLHIDVASDYRLSGYLSNFIATTFIDIRPIKTNLKNLSVRKGSALNLPFKNNSVTSLSCLHVIEHIGLGRYGDPLDPVGYEKAGAEFVRVLKKGGYLYIATPIGKEQVYFNAHRVFSPLTIVQLFKDLELIEFSVITDADKYLQMVNPKRFLQQNYACGLFVFKKI